MPLVIFGWSISTRLHPSCGHIFRRLLDDYNSPPYKMLRHNLCSLRRPSREANGSPGRQHSIAIDTLQVTRPSLTTDCWLHLVSFDGWSNISFGNSWWSAEWERSMEAIWGTTRCIDTNASNWWRLAERALRERRVFINFVKSTIIVYRTLILWLLAFLTMANIVILSFSPNKNEQF